MLKAVSRYGEVATSTHQHHLPIWIERPSRVGCFRKSRQRSRRGQQILPGCRTPPGLSSSSPCQRYYQEILLRSCCLTQHRFHPDSTSVRLLLLGCLHSSLPQQSSCPLSANRHAFCTRPRRVLRCHGVGGRCSLDGTLHAACRHGSPGLCGLRRRGRALR